MSTKGTTDKFLSIDLRILHRRGVIRPGRHCGIRWVNGPQSGELDVRAADNSLILSYEHPKRNSDGWILKHYPVQIAWTPCNYGGRRPWFICPGSGCGRRVAILYVDEMFVCRHCSELVYRSQRQQPYQRALSRAQTIRIKLGGTGSMSQKFPDKPPRLHWRTYERLSAKAEEAAARSWPPWLLNRIRDQKQTHAG
jgi:hypothetical protein